MSRFLSHIKWIFLCILLLGFPVSVAALTGAEQIYRWNQLEVDGPSARHSHAMAYDVQRDVVVLFGGLFGGNSRDSILLGDTWEWNGCEWRLVAETGPSPRMGHAMVYDSKRGAVILFGGNDGAPLSDTWEWNGQEWRLLLASGPGARSRHAMAYDSDREVAVVFGGIPREPDDTWEWDGNSWRIAAVSGPEGRSRAGMVYDAAEKLIVLFGGRLPDGKMLGDTWIWDGSEWIQVASDDLFARSRHSMVYDSAKDLIIVHGVSFGGRNEMMEWDGTRWSPLGASLQRNVMEALLPPRRVYYSMIYIDSRETVLLFGGWDGSASLSDTWELIIE